MLLSPWPFIYWPKTGGERLPNVFLNNTNIKSLGSLSSTAIFAQTSFVIHAVVCDILAA